MAERAFYLDVRADSRVLAQVGQQAFRATFSESLAFHQFVRAVVVVHHHVLMLKLSFAAHISTFEFKLCECLINTFGHLNELCIIGIALGWTMPSHSQELIQASLMELLLALRALQWFAQHCLANGAQGFGLD